jgi:tetratricopeptide (TPR) repeat protein
LKSSKIWQILHHERDLKSQASVTTHRVLAVTSASLRDEVFTFIYSKKRVDEAILRLNNVIKATPENSEAIALKAYALNKLANIRREWQYSAHALDYAERALALNPNDDIALTSKGWALIDLGRAEEALKPLEQATLLNPRNQYAWYNLAWAQYLTGNAAASTESLKAALGIDPGNSIIRRGKDSMEKGELPEHLRKLGRNPSL